ncbi:MAG: hypothetical protein AAGL69_09430 [Pseudomonadota bacterium]
MKLRKLAYIQLHDSRFRIRMVTDEQQNGYREFSSNALPGSEFTHQSASALTAELRSALKSLGAFQPGVIKPLALVQLMKRLPKRLTDNERSNLIRKIEAAGIHEPMLLFDADTLPSFEFLMMIRKRWFRARAQRHV